MSLMVMEIMSRPACSETYETVNGRKWAADYAKEHFDGKANVAVLSYPAEQPCLDAENGFLEGLKAELGKKT